ncbi:MAG: hypothetical protein FWD45_02925 [Coriobacteriia bacterium]|nr:hypothetical protein [Coriobacteriia bacterium]
MRTTIRTGAAMKAYMVSIKVLMTALLVLVVPLGLFGCRNRNAPLSVTYTIDSWDDVQIALDRANNGDVINLSSLWSPGLQYSLTIPSDLELTLIGHNHVVFYGVSFSCAGHNTVTIENLSIVSLNNQEQSAFHFSGKQNQLIFAGVNMISNSNSAEKSGYGAAIGVPDGSELLITGKGALRLAGANGAAGIGGGQGKAGGNITIDAPDGLVAVNYGGGGAGIGGGANAAGGSITINDGLVQVQSGSVNLHAGSSISSSGDSSERQGAAIGGGYKGAAGKVNINGGQIIVTGNTEAALIGGGSSGGAGGEIIITGGLITASNYGNGTCLGGSPGAAEAKIKMSGGSVYVVASAAAINGIFDDLPLAYRWQTSNMPILDATEMKYFPGDPYRGSATYPYIIIESNEVLSVAVAPLTAEVPTGGSRTFTAGVVATGGATTDVRWSIRDNTSAQTQIDAEGVLNIASDETATTIIVVATSIAYNDKTGEATVTVVATAVEP